MFHRSKSQVRKTRQPIEGLFCTYSHRVCMQSRLEGYEFCLKHILEDKNSPFKQCSYTSAKSGKKCMNAAPKSDRKEGYCLDHSRRALLMRQRASRKKRPKETPEMLLEEMDHYSAYGKRGEKVLNSDQIENKKSLASIASKVLEYASSSDSDAETPVVDQAWRGDGDSDAESIDSEQEDLLKHAGIHTAEEVALIMRDKLIRLQSLYIDQFKRLQHVMKERRRKYLHATGLEKETQGSIGQYLYDPDQQENFKKLTAMKRYHRRYGQEALLHRQSKQRRIAMSEGVNYKPPMYPKCIFTETDGKCPECALPLTKYCLKHIMHDTHQVLFRGCSFADGTCGRPVSAMEEGRFCSLHSPLKDFEQRLNLMRDSTPEPMKSEGPNVAKVTAGEGSGYNSSEKLQSLEKDFDPNSEAALMKKGRLLLQHLQSIDAKLKAQKKSLPSPLLQTKTHHPLSSSSRPASSITSTSSRPASNITSTSSRPASNITVFQTGKTPETISVPITAMTESDIGVTASGPGTETKVQAPKVPTAIRLPNTQASLISTTVSTVPVSTKSSAPAVVDNTSNQSAVEPSKPSSVMPSSSSPSVSPSTTTSNESPCVAKQPASLTLEPAVTFATATSQTTPQSGSRPGSTPATTSEERMEVDVEGSSNDQLNKRD